MNRVERAIIMAAGKGTRMLPITLKTPKPLVKINGIRMIDTVIQALHHNGIFEIYIVSGYLKEQFRVLENEYNVEVKLEKLPYEYIRWVENKEEVDVAKIQGTSDMKRICDLKGNPLLLFINSWSVGMVEERNPNLKLSEFGKN